MVTKARQLAELISNSLVDSDEISTGAVTTSKLASTLDFSSKTMVMADNQLSGDKIHGGTVSAFASTGIDDNASSTAVTIDSSGNVGIGTSSPEGSLHLNGSFAGRGLVIDLATEGVTDNVGTFNAKHSAGILAFQTNSTERMRITSLGTVLVGKTSEGTETDGIELNRNDVIVATRNNDSPLILNRRTSDGDITVFRKDNAAVGSIGAVSGDIVVGTGNTGLRFYDAGRAIQPRHTDGSAANDVIDLGMSANRFKDLYLSGTVHATNLLPKTSDGADNEQLVVGGGGAASDSRGASIHLAGNENGNAGLLQLRAGNGSVGGIRLYTAATERMRLDSSGNVGIGTTTPPSKLSIEGDGIAFRIDGTGNTSRGILFRNVGGSAEGFIQTDGSMHFLQEDAGKYIRFSTANTERMRINSSGRQSYNGNATAVAHGNFVGEVASSGYRALSFEHTVGGGEVGSIRTSSSTAVYYGDGSQLTGVGGSTNWSEVGTYMLGQEDLGNVTESHTIAGSNLRPAGFFGNTSGLLNDNSTGCNLTGGNTTQSGTWRRMSRSNNGGGDIHAGLYLRIS